MTRTFLLFLLKERNLCHEKIYDMLLGSRERSESTFLHLWFFKYLQVKITNMPKWLILEWHVLNPFTLLCISNLLTILFTFIFFHIICSKWKANEIIHCNCKKKKSCSSFISVFYCLCNIQSFLIFFWYNYAIKSFFHKRLYSIFKFGFKHLDLLRLNFVEASYYDCSYC